MKKAVTLILLFLLTCVYVLQLLPLGSAQTIEETFEPPVTVRLRIEVYEIDQEKRQANVSVIAYINNYPDNETEIEVWIMGAGYAIFNCTQGRQDPTGWFYSGESNRTVWSLEGDGELFPFDTYSLRFTIHYVGRIEGANCTFVDEGHLAYFAGPQTYYLNNLWKRTNSLLPIASVTEQEIKFNIQRANNAVIVAFLELFVPILACYYLLGSALILDPKHQLAERLRIFLSIFFFVPSFFIATQAFFPYRVLLSFPESLLVNLLVSTAVLGVFSIIGNQYEPSTGTIIDNVYSSRFFERIMDSIGVLIALSFLLGIYWATLIDKINPILSIFLTYLITPAYVFWIPLSKTHRYRISRKMILSLLIGIILSLITYSISLIFFSFFAHIITLGGIVIGVILGFYIRNLARGAVMALISGVLGTLLAGIIAGALMGGVEGIFYWIQVFGVIGNLFGIYSLFGALILGLLLAIKKD